MAGNDTVAGIVPATMFDIGEATPDDIEQTTIADTIEARQYRERIGAGCWRVLAAYDTDGAA